jgi:hypothetical protein
MWMLIGTVFPLIPNLSPKPMYKVLMLGKIQIPYCQRKKQKEVD